MIDNNEYLLNEYLTYMDAVLHYAPASIRLNKVLCQKWFIFLKNRNISNVTEAATEDVLAWIEYRRCKEKVSDRTISAELSMFRTLYSFLISFCGSTDPVGSLPSFICKPADEKKYLSVDEVFKLLETYDTSDPIGLRNYMVIALLWSTGLRTKELLSLQWRDINLDYGTLLVRKGKGRKQRQLFLNDRILNDLRAYRCGILVKKTTPVFLSYSKKTKTPGLVRRQLSDIIRNATRKAGIKKNITPLTLRHTFATHMYEAGVHVKDIQEMMGHGHRTETTVYIHVTMNAAIKLLNNHVYHTFIHKEQRSHEKNYICQ